MLYLFTGEEKIKPADIHFEFNWLPDGYVLADEFDGGSFIDYIFENDKTGDSIVFSCVQGGSDTVSGMIDIGSRDTETGYFNGMEYELFFPSIDIPDHDCIFFDEQNGLSYIISTTSSPETIFKILENTKMTKQ